MEFEITRTSTYDEQPCPESVKRTRTKVDTRFADDPSKVKSYGGTTDWWYSNGTNHRIVNGYITRDLGTEEYWSIEFNSLEELIAFTNKYGAVVISELEIEIIDDYMD